MSATRRELLEERWKVAETRPAQFKGEYEISAINSKRYERIHESMKYLAAQLVEEVSADEAGELDTELDDIWKDIKKRLLDWAERIEAAREARKAA